MRKNDVRMIIGDGPNPAKETIITVRREEAIIGKKRTEKRRKSIENKEDNAGPPWATRHSPRLGTRGRRAVCFCVRTALHGVLLERVGRQGQPGKRQLGAQYGTRWDGMKQRK